MNNQQCLAQIKKMLATINEYSTQNVASIAFPLQEAKLLAELAYAGCFAAEDKEELPDNVIDFKKWVEENRENGEKF